LGFILRGAGLFQLTSSCFRPGYEQAHKDALPEHRLQYTGPYSSKTGCTGLIKAKEEWPTFSVRVEQFGEERTGESD